MANIGNKMASVTIVLNGVQETINGLDNIKQRSKELKVEMAGLKDAMAKSAASGNGQEWSSQAARLGEVEAEHKKLQAAIREGNKAVKDMNTLMQDLDKKTLKQLQADLKLAQQKFRVIRPEDLSNLSKGKEIISAIQGEIAKRNAGAGLKQTLTELSSTLSNLKTTPLERLRDAQKRLTEAISTSTRGTKEYQDAVRQLKNVNKQIDSVTRSYQGQDNAIMKVAKRLSSYVMVYMGFNQILGQIKSIVRGNIELSDSIADIQKVTKMTTGQVDALARTIDSLDTRSSQEQLYKLGYQAGMLGLKSTQDIMGFIEAADQMNWALKELGDDGAVQLMKVANLTGEVVKKGGVKNALNAVGSAINEITASSASSAAPIVDFVSRLGAVGAAAGYSSHELVAIGSTLDSLGVHAEMGSTAMNKFMIALQTNRSSIADKLGMTSDEMARIAQDVDGSSGSIRLMVDVLQRLHEAGGASANTMEVLEPIFKDLGSEGQRMITTLTTLIENVDVFNEHLNITKNAYEEGVSMLNEYNVKNETAAATFARLGNTIRERFVNSGFVRWIQDIGKGFVNLVNHANRYQAVLIPLKTVLSSVSLYLAAIFTKSLVGLAKSMYASVKQLGVAYKDNLASLVALDAAKKQDVVATEGEVVANAELAVAEGAASVASTTLTMKLKALWATMVANPMTTGIAILGAFAGAIMSIVDALTAESEVEKIQADATKKVTETIFEESAAANQKFEILKQLTAKEQEYKDKLDAAKAAGEDTTKIEQELNKAHTERKKSMKDINDSYAPMLGYMLKEQDSMSNIIAAQKQYNALLQEKQALMIRDAINEAASTNLKSVMTDEMEDISDNLKDMADNMELAEEKWGAFTGAATARIIQMAQAGKTTEDIVANIRKLAKTMGATGGDGDFNSGQLRSGIDAITGAFKNLKDWSEVADTAYKQTMSDIAKTEQKNLEERAKAIESRTSRAFYDWQKASNSADRQKFANEFKIGFDELQNIAEKSGKKLADKWIEWNDKIKVYSLTTTNEVSSGVIDSAKITTMTVDETVSALKRVNNLIGMKQKGPEFLSQARKVLGDINVDAKTASERLVKLGQQIRKRQDELGVTAEGKVKTESSSNSKSKDEQKVKQDVDAWKKYLKDYYTQRQNEEQKQFEEYSNTHNAKDIASEKAVMEEKTRALEEEYKVQLSELDSALLGMENKFGDGGIFGDYFEKLLSENKLSKLDDLAKRIQQFGKKMWDDLQEDMSDAEKKRLQSVIKHLDDLYKIANKYDFVQLAEDQFKESLVKQGLYNAASYDSMKSFAADAYNIEEGHLEAIFNLNEVQAQALLVLLRDYHDAAIEAEKKQKQRKKKIFDEQYQDTKEYYKAQQTLLDENTASVKEMQSLGIASDQDVTKMEILALQAKMAVQQEYVEQLKANNADAAQAELELYNIQKDIAGKHAELNKEKLDVLKDYCDAVVDFGESMGEAAFGEVADRKAAAKELLKSMMDTTRKLILEWTKQLIQKRMLKAQERSATQVEAQAEVAIEQAKNQQIAASNAQATLQSIGVKKAEVPANVAAGTASGGAETVGQMGWWGIPLMAVIGAALSALGGMAMSALNKSEDEVEEETGVSASEATKFAKKKVAANMMTYADGSYPVMGSDGNQYHARKVNRWGTQVYSGAHYGIVGEKMPEMIIDGQTTNKMMTLRPDLYQEIMNLRDGIIRGNVTAYASGRYPAQTATVSRDTSRDNTDLLNAIREMVAINTQLHNTLQAGIRADLVEDYSRNGVVNRMEQNRKWMQDHGLLN